MKFKTLKYSPVISWLEVLSPGKNHVPDWYRKIPTTNLNPKRLPSIKTAKSCVPFLDSFLTGYIATTPIDIAVEVDKLTGIPLLSWGNQDMTVMEERSHEAIPTLPIPEGFHNNHFIWRTHMCVQTPKGYSLLVGHPLNRLDLPFFTLSGVVDADGVLTDGNLPFLLRKGFEGLIPAGTPFAQLIPIKREEWKLQKDEGLVQVSSDNGKMAASRMGYYKAKFWQKKKYE
jgi:hypothetical protein